MEKDFNIEDNSSAKPQVKVKISRLTHTANEQTPRGPDGDICCACVCREALRAASRRFISPSLKCETVVQTPQPACCSFVNWDSC